MATTPRASTQANPVTDFSQAPTPQAERLLSQSQEQRQGNLFSATTDPHLWSQHTEAEFATRQIAGAISGSIGHLHIVLSHLVELAPTESLRRYYADALCRAEDRKMGFEAMIFNELLGESKTLNLVPDRAFEHAEALDAQQAAMAERDPDLYSLLHRMRSLLESRNIERRANHKKAVTRITKIAADQPPEPLPDSA